MVKEHIKVREMSSRVQKRVVVRLTPQNHFIEALGCAWHIKICNGHLHAVVKKGIFQLQKRHETLYALTNCRLITFRKCRIKRQGIFALTKKSDPILNPAIIFIKTDHLQLHKFNHNFNSGERCGFRFYVLFLGVPLSTTS